MKQGMPWIKLWCDLIHDDKLAEVSRSARLRFVELLCLAGECDADGALMNGNEAMSMARIAFRLHDAIDVVCADVEALIALKLVLMDRRGAVVIRNWEKRQGERWQVRREKINERVTRYRNKSNALQARYKTKSNAPVTPLEVEVEVEVEKKKKRTPAVAGVSTATAPAPVIPPSSTSQTPEHPIATTKTPVIPDAMRTQKAPPRKAKPPKDDLSEHDDPRVAAYLEILRPVITDTNARLICQRVTQDHLAEWRDVLVLWATSEWRATNFAGMFERYDAAVAGARARHLFGRPAAVAQDGTYRGKPGMIP